jgi:hypothetical protein
LSQRCSLHRAATQAARVVACILSMLACASVRADNAADRYREAMAMLLPASLGLGSPAGVLTLDDLEAISVLPPVPTAADRERVAPILAKTAEARALLEAASRIGRCDWGLDRDQGFALLLPHAGSMRALAFLVRAQAVAESSDGNQPAALAALATLGSIAGHVAQDDVTISSMVAGRIGRLLAGTGAVVLDSGAVDAKQAQSLLDSLGPLKGDDPFRFGPAVRGEFDMLAATLRKADSDQELRTMLEMAGSTEDHSGLTLDVARAELRSLRPAFERAARAMESPNPEQAMAELRRLESAARAGSLGALAKLVFPDLLRIHASKLNATRELALFLERLRAIAEGKDPEAALPNAAVPLARASAGARALDAESQELVELVRVAPGALDESRAVRAADLLARLDRAVFAPLVEAAACRRCDFAVLRMPSPSLDARFLGGLRGAVRAALADGLRRARAERSPDAAAPAVITAWRTVTLVAMDPSLARAAVCGTILGDANAALAEAMAIGAMRPATVDELERTLARMNATDPVGFRVALAADARRTVASMARMASGASPEAREAREKILVQRGATAMLARVAFADTRLNDDTVWPTASDGALVRLTDVFPVPAIERLRAAAAAWDARRIQARERGTEPLDGYGLALVIDPPVPFDLPIEDQRTMFRKEDPVRGVDFVEVNAMIAASDAAFIAAGDAVRSAGHAARTAAAQASGTTTAPPVPAPTVTE